MCKNHDHDHDYQASKNIELIQEILDQKELQTTFLELEDGTEVAEEMAQLLDCEVGQIIHATLFKNANDYSDILVLASSPKRPTEKLVQSIIGERAIMQADQVPPIGYNQPTETLIDRDLLEYPELWAITGEPNIIFSIDGDELQYLTGGKIIDIK